MVNPMHTTQTSQNKFEEKLKLYILWIRSHQEQFWAISITVLGAILLTFFMIKRRQADNEEAWTQLGAAQGYIMQGQTAPATKALDDWFARYKGTGATTYAKFLRADLLYNTSNYAGAADLYGDLVQTGRPKELRPLALSAQAASEEMAGRLPQAQALTQQFLDHYADHYLAASMYISQARLAELSGSTSNATALYDRFVILYPQSPWTEFARARIQLLTPATPPIQK
jgi:outer membrane protein assembly factor BamD (BamD/ComL family)